MSTLLNSCGVALEISEDLIDAAIGVSGSGPVRVLAGRTDQASACGVRGVLGQSHVGVTLALCMLGYSASQPAGFSELQGAPGFSCNLPIAKPVHTEHKANSFQTHMSLGTRCRRTCLRRSRR